MVTVTGDYDRGDREHRGVEGRQRRGGDKRQHAIGVETGDMADDEPDGDTWYAPCALARLSVAMRAGMGF